MYEAIGKFVVTVIIINVAATVLVKAYKELNKN